MMQSEKLLNRNERCTAADLKPGDRFIRQNDKKRIVYQMLKRNWKTISVVNGAIADRGHSFEQLMKWGQEIKYNTQVIYIRNVQQNNEAIQKESNCP